ncbi:DUF3883 domain-containing protein [uncultured Azohydromonas sp.]|uniref:DUF3883 domain-containing protein n=1 Tax=uncultured Azohydromonas sp. TaxID=487342 RepID=UPI00262927FF|nr:DUF3883 domain-containing protein [uncultured Azohydromonas sp.]
MFSLKRLRASDLSLFKTYFLDHPGTNQKGFNLDVKIMEGKFFPDLRALLESLPKHAAHVDLTLVGPGGAEPHSLARKVKRDAKNIRLNGECVDAPVDDPERYDVLAPNDLAVMEFIGCPLPVAVNVVLIARSHELDQCLYKVFDKLMPDVADSMRSLSLREIEDAILECVLPKDHPILDWLEDGLLEEVGQGNARVAEEINARRSGRGMDPEAFMAAKASAERTGRWGEELLNGYFESLYRFPGSGEYEWVSRANAISPFDFRFSHGTHAERHIDAKSTSGPFERPIYMSVAEIRHAVHSGIPYDIYRLFHVTEDAAVFRIARDVGPKLAEILDALVHLPTGASVESLSFDPSFFEFSLMPHTIGVEDPLLAAISGKPVF